MESIQTTKKSIRFDITVSDYHLLTAKNIHSLLNSGNVGKLGKIIRSIPQADYWQVIYAFYELYGYSFNSRIQSLNIQDKELKSFGII